MSTITANGVRLFYELTGDTGDPLVLVHGSWTDHHSWDAIVPLLTPTFRVLRYDRRGHSQSERPAGQGSFHEDVADLAALIDQLGLGPVHIVGNSSGGAIVLRFAAEHPHLIRSLVVHEPALFDLLAGDPAVRAALQTLETRVAAVAEQLRRGDMSGGARRFYETIAMGPGAWGRFPPETQQTFIANAPTWLDEMQDPEAPNIDIVKLAGISRPALLTYGDQSPPFFAPVVEKIASAMPTASIQVIAGAGHVPQRTHPDAYAEVIKRFVGDDSRVVASNASR